MLKEKGLGEKMRLEFPRWARIRENFLLLPIYLHLILFGNNFLKYFLFIIKKQENI